MQTPPAVSPHFYLEPLGPKWSDPHATFEVVQAAPIDPVKTISTLCTEVRKIRIEELDEKTKFHILFVAKTRFQVLGQQERFIEKSKWKECSGPARTLTQAEYVELARNYYTEWEFVCLKILQTMDVPLPNPSPSAKGLEVSIINTAPFDESQSVAIEPLSSPETPLPNPVSNEEHLSQQASPSTENWRKDLLNKYPMPSNTSSGALHTLSTALVPLRFRHLAWHTAFLPEWYLPVEVPPSPPPSPLSNTPEALSSIMREIPSNPVDLPPDTPEPITPLGTPELTLSNPSESASNDMPPPLEPPKALDAPQLLNKTENDSKTDNPPPVKKQTSFREDRTLSGGTLRRVQSHNAINTTDTKQPPQQTGSFRQKTKISWLPWKV